MASKNRCSKKTRYCRITNSSKKCDFTMCDNVVEVKGGECDYHKGKDRSLDIEFKGERLPINRQKSRIIDYNDVSEDNKQLFVNLFDGVGEQSAKWRKLRDDLLAIKLEAERNLEIVVQQMKELEALIADADLDENVITGLKKQLKELELERNALVAQHADIEEIEADCLERAGELSWEMQQYLIRIEAQEKKRPEEGPQQEGPQEEEPVHMRVDKAMGSTAPQTRADINTRSSKKGRPAT